MHKSNCNQSSRAAISSTSRSEKQTAVLALCDMIANLFFRSCNMFEEYARLMETPMSNN